jgi:hypothetical protein
MIVDLRDHSIINRQSTIDNPKFFLYYICYLPAVHVGFIDTLPLNHYSAKGLGA